MAMVRVRTLGLVLIGGRARGRLRQCAQRAAALPRHPIRRPAAMPAAAYQLSPQELGYSCKKLTGVMQIRILQVRHYDPAKTASVTARGMQSVATPIFGGTTVGIDPAGQHRQDLAMLEAYNHQLAAKKCKTFDLAAELQKPAPDVRNRARQRQAAADDRSGDARFPVRAPRQSGVKLEAFTWNLESMAHTGSDTAERPSRIPWPPLLLVGVLAGAVVLGRMWPLPWPGLDDWPARAVGLGLGAAGVVLLVVSILTLRRHGTTVLPDVGATQLVTSGPYRPLAQPDLPRRLPDPLRRRRAHQERLVRDRLSRVRDPRHPPRHHARGAPSGTALRRGLPRLQGEDAPVALV